MREIKFRAWDTENKVMMFRELAQCSDWIGKNVVLMQYTGLKDKNGKEIYEGDIISIATKFHPEFNDKIYRKVSFEPRAPACGFILGDSEHDYIEHFGKIMKDDDTDWDITVEGNIYENPELLKRN